MKKQQKLVLQNLEDISWMVLDEYPQIIKKLIKGKSGVYALYKRNKLYYIGLASNLMGRLRTHLKDRHHNKWDRFSVYLTIKTSHIKELESLLLRVTNPPGNRQKGKFIKSQELKFILNNLIKEADDDKRARLIGGSFAKRRQKIKAKKAGGKNSLAGLFSRRIQLRAVYKGKTYIASLRKDGTISYKNKIYQSPTSVAKIIIKRNAVNGWTFWRYKNDKNEWVRLRTLKK